ncbi:MAG: ABC transporter permease [Lachnospiraceae bacterium]|nr:ABC transporter permease [Lachnospiraceae bacterium]
MLFKLAVKNIRKSMQDYAIYFFTLVLGVAIFYVFNAIGSQTVADNLSQTTYEIIGLMNSGLAVVSVFVSVILGALIIYASRFLMKRRNKEFGVYLTLGMSRRRVSMVLFVETLLIGLISLGIGLGLGVILSQFMSIIVANIFEADMSKFTFVFSGEAFRKTLVYFGIMYLLVMIFNTISVSRCRLIDLLNGAKKNEKQKLKSPLLCSILFFVACAALGYAYYMVSDGLEDMSRRVFVGVLILGAVSTFLIFWSLSGLLLKLFMAWRRSYYRGLNSFTLRQFASKINTMVLSMTIICLMLFITICVLGSAFSISRSMNANIKAMAPMDVQIEKSWNKEWPSNPEIEEDSKVDVVTTLKRNGYQVERELKDVTIVNYYWEQELTIQSFLEEYLDDVLKNYAFIRADQPELLMKISDYNRVAALFGTEVYSLGTDEYIVISDLDSVVTARNYVLWQGKTITIDGKEYHSKYTECQPGFVEMASSHINVGIILVPDEAVNDSMLYENILLANYNVEDKVAKDVSEQRLVELLDEIYITKSFFSYDTRQHIADASVGLGAIVTFIGLYLGIIFLMASAAVLALKELSESADNGTRFEILRKIGTDERMLNCALFRQIGIFFLFPLLLAVIHSVFGLKCCNIILETFGTGQMGNALAITALIIVAIYGGYFLVTYFSSKRMLKSEQ